MVHLPQNMEYLIEHGARLFLMATAEIKAVMNDMPPNSVTVKNHFEQVLLHIYPILIHQDLPAIEQLVESRLIKFGISLNINLVFSQLQLLVNRISRRSISEQRFIFIRRVIHHSDVTAITR